MAKKKKAIKTNTTKKPRFQKMKWFFSNRQTQTIFGMFFVLFAIFIFVAFASFLFSWEIDQSEISEFSNRTSNVDNLLGKIGNSLSEFFMRRGFGIAVFVFPILLFLTGIYVLLHIKLKKIRKSWGWGILGMIWFSISFGFITKEGSLLSGVVGYELNIYLKPFLGKIGILLLLAFTLFTYLAIRFKLNANHIISLFKKKENNTLSDVIVEDETNIISNFSEPEIKEETKEKNKTDFELSVDNLQPTISNYLGKESEKIEKSEDKDIILDIQLKPTSKDEIVDEITIDVEKIIEEKSESKNLSDKLVEDFGEFDPKLELANFKFPTLNLLRDFNESIAVDQEELEANKNKIVETLNNYKIGIAKIKATVRSEEHTSELQSQAYLVCRLLLEKKKKT